MSEHAAQHEPTVEVLTETEVARGWTYRVAVTRAEGTPTEHAVNLSWADHEHWCAGAAAPSRVVAAVVRFLLEHEAERPLPPRFDAATARRWFPAIDRELSLPGSPAPD